MKSVNVRETISLERFRLLLNINVELKTKYSYAKEKRIRPGAVPKPSASEGSPTILQGKSLQLFLQRLRIVPLTL